MGVRSQGNAVCSDLIRRVAVCGDSVRADNRYMNPPQLHQIRRHVVADQRDRDPMPLKFPCGQPCPLQKRAGFVGEYLESLPGLVSPEENGQRRAVGGRCQTAGVTVGKYRLSVLDDIGAVPADLAARQIVFVSN